MITSDELRRLANSIPNSGFVGDLRRLAEYFEDRGRAYLIAHNESEKARFTRLANDQT